MNFNQEQSNSVHGGRVWSIPVNESSIAWQTLRKEFNVQKISLIWLMKVAEKIRQEFGISPSRKERRTRSGMVEWLTNNWDIISWSIPSIVREILNEELLEQQAANNNAN